MKFFTLILDAGYLSNNVLIQCIKYPVSAYYFYYFEIFTDFHGNFQRTKKSIDMIEVLEKEKLLTVEEYHKLEETATQKSEFINGKLNPMPGGSSNHADIIGNIYMTLRLTLKSLGKKFRVFNSDLKIHLAAHNQNVYPDAFVITEKPQYVDNKFSVSNPTLIVEVLSDSTARYDRGSKCLKYKSLPSFTEYVLIEQDMPMVDVITKKEENWIIKSYVGLKDTVVLESIGCEISMEDIYENVEDLKNPQGIMDFEKDVD